MKIGALQDLLSRDMDRREFLTHLGAATLALVGVSGIIKAFTDPHGQIQARSNGYGATRYGGERKLGQTTRKLN